MTIKTNQLEIPFTTADKSKLDAIQASAEVNPAFASQVVAEAGIDNAQIMTALRVKQAIAVFASASGEVNTASNLGSGDAEVFAQKSAVDLQFRSLVAGTNVTLDQSSTTITINASGGGGGGADLSVEDEGSEVDSAVTIMDFVGDGVTVTQTASGAVEVNIPGTISLTSEYSFSLSASGTIAGRTPTGLPDGWTAVNGNDGSVDAELSGSADDLVLVHGETATAIDITVIKIDGSTPFGGSGRFKIDSSGAANERVKTNSSQTQSRIKNFQLDVGNFAAVVYVKLI